MNLKMTCTPAAAAVRPSDHPRLVYLRVDIEGQGMKTRAPGYLVLVIDCSESMRIRLVTEEQFRFLARGGEMVEVLTDGVPAWQVKNIDPEMIHQLPTRMGYVIQGLERFGEQIGEQDRYALVAFASEALLLAPFTGGADRAALREAIERLETLGLGDETSLADGLRVALDQFRLLERREGTRRIVLLTDGYTADVARCYALADEARKARVPVTTIGVGAEFNERLLIPLADRTGGSAYYIDQPETLPDIFAREAEAALSAPFHNLDLYLRMPEGVSLRRISRVAPEIGRLDTSVETGGALSVYLGDFPHGGRIQLLAELVIDRPFPGERPLAQFDLRFEESHRPLTGQTHQHIQCAVTVSVSPDAVEQVDSGTARAVQKVTAYQVGSRALEEAPHLPPAEAARRLQQAADRLGELGESRLAASIAQQAAAIASQGKMDARATKKLIYETRQLQEGKNV